MAHSTFFPPGENRLHARDGLNSTLRAGQYLPRRLVEEENRAILYRTDDIWAIVSSADKIEPGSGKLPIEALEVRVEPRAEWVQIFREAWRINRDYFYGPNMHGADWQATGEKYEIFLEHLANRDDLNRSSNGCAASSLSDITVSRAATRAPRPSR